MDSDVRSYSALKAFTASRKHMHPTDGSMHFSLSPTDTREALGDLHGLAGPIYKPDQALLTTNLMAQASAQ